MALSTDDIAQIARNPKVGAVWARMANLKYGQLRNGNPKMAARLRAAIVKDPAAFANALAPGWDNLLDDGDRPDDQFDELALRAIAVGFLLGPKVGSALVYSVADSDLPHSEEVRRRLDELLEHATNPPPYGGKGWPAGLILRPIPPTDGDEPDQDDSEAESDLADESGLFIGEAAAVVARTSEDTDREPLLADMRDLGVRMQAAAGDLVDRLRAAATAIEQGRPADQLGLAVDNWSISVSILLGSADALGIGTVEDMNTLVARLSELDAERAARDAQRLEDARVAGELIAVLQRTGRTAMIESTLTQFGFGSLEELESVLAGTAAEPSGEGDDADRDAEPDGGGELDEEAAEAGEIAGEAGEEAEAEETAGEAAAEAETVQAEAESSGEESVEDEHLGAADSGEPRDEQPAPVSPAEVSDSAATVQGQPSGEPATRSAGAAAVEEEKPDEGDSLPADYPWDIGDPPLIGQLLMEGREGLAYHLAVAADETQPRRQLLLFACAAAHCDPGALELSLLPADADIRAFDANESRLLLAAALRAGMRLGYAPLGFQSLIDAAGLGDTGLMEVFTAAANAVQRGHTRRQPQSGPSGEELAARWADLGRDSAAQLDKLRTRNLKFQRGSKVLRHMAKDGQPLAEALTAAAAVTAEGVAGASGPQWSQVSQLVEQLNDHHKREKLIDAADAEVSTSQQRRNPIIGPVSAQLHESLRDTGDLLSRLLNVRRAILSADLKDIGAAEDVERALAQAPADLVAHSVGDAALIAFVDWLRGDEPEPTAKSVQEVLDGALLELFELPRGRDGRPARPPTPAEITVLLTPRDPQVVVEGYLDKGDIAAARNYIGAAGLEGTGYGDRMLQATKAAQAQFDEARGEAEDGAARLKALYKDELARDLSQRIQLLGAAPEGDRFDLAIEALRAIAAEADEALVAERHAMEERTRALACDEASKARVLDRLANADETLAVEFLTLLETGQPLPEVQAPQGDDFSEFLPRIVAVAAEAQSGGEDPIAAIQAAVGVGAVPPDRQLREGLAAWKTLKTKRRAGDQYRASLATVLRMIGLSPRAQDWYRGDVSRAKLSGYSTARIMVADYDRSYVPQLGSQAHDTFDVTMVWDPVTPNRLMDFIEERNRNRANVVLYFGVLSFADRLQLRALSRTTAGGKGFSPIVIDEAVIGWLSTRTEAGWGFTQRVTLPFTTLNPYQPNAAGEVPDEVFVGRADERNRIESPTGSMFVYGGRQLGKSALLRRVERLYTDLQPVDGHPLCGTAAVYIDLKAAGIGEAQEPAALWPLLGERLHKLGILTAKAPPSTARDVTGAVLGWLNSETSNSLLLLLDEADNFLTRDSSAGTVSAVGAFPVLQALKGLMEESGRRFKAVFAGLHQVLRFHDASNTPVAHGGDDILIGPLRTLDAFKLVESPIKALGYQFESPELVWRLLLQTNYQASLVQIVCDALVRHLQKRQIPEGGGRMIITDRDIREVCTDPKVSDLIAQRFRWTINLDSRYRLIALVVAVLSLGAEPGVTFGVDDLRAECEFWWSDGFGPEELTRNEFERYLVEMEGLGILQRHAGGERWALRSPNVIQMLGSPERLQKELQDAGQNLERPLEYNPAMARQLLADSEGIAAPRSPLTDSELTDLLKMPEGPPAPAQVVFGSPALGIDRVVEVVKAAARAENIEPIVVENPSDPQIKKAGGGGKRGHIIVDLSRAKAAEVNVAHICRELGGRKHVTATMVLGPAWLPMLDGLDEAVTVHKLRRWSTAGLRAWYGSPFEGPDARARLHRVTSGWPKLLEAVMADIAKARSQEESLERVDTRLKTPEGARDVLEQSGIDLGVARAWISAIPFDGTGQLAVSVEDVTEAIGVDGARLLADLEALDLVTQDEDGWSLDRIILAAAATTFDGRE